MTAKSGNRKKSATRTHIHGDVHGPVLSGRFNGPVNIGAQDHHEIGPATRERRERAREDVDVVILTVLSEEFEAFRRRLADSWRWPGTGSMANLYAWHLADAPRTDGGAYRIALGMTGRAGTNKSVAATLNAVSQWQPRYVFFAGIAGGLGKAQKGDVIIADTIYAYEYGKIEAGRYLVRADRNAPTDEALFSGACAYAARPAWKRGIQAEPPGAAESIVRAEAVASGDKVVDDPTYEFFDEVLKVYPKASAVEMEGAGVGCAIQQAQAEGHQVGFLMIRGISDLPRRPGSGEEQGSGERERWKAYAADVAAAFTLGYIADGLPVPPREPVEDISSSDAASPVSPTSAQKAARAGKSFLRTALKELSLDEIREIGAAVDAGLSAGMTKSAMLAALLDWAATTERQHALRNAIGGPW